MMANAHGFPPRWTLPIPSSQLYPEIVITYHHSANIYYKFYYQLAILCMSQGILPKAL